MEKSMKKNVYICITKSLCSTVEIITTLQTNYISIKFFKCSNLPGGEVLERCCSFRDGKGRIPRTELSSVLCVKMYVVLVIPCHW